MLNINDIVIRAFQKLKNRNGANFADNL